MVSTFLNILHETLSPGRPYCQLPPIVYLELGFATGVPSARLEMYMVKTIDDCQLVKNFVSLCTGATAISYKRSPIQSMDKVHGIVTLGEQLTALGQSNGWAATEQSFVYKQATDKPKEVPAGAIVMLPRVEDDTLFSSVFYITTQKQVIHEGEVIGYMEAGLEQLMKLVREFGSNNGELKKEMFVHDCGQL